MTHGFDSGWQRNFEPKIPIDYIQIVEREVVISFTN